MFDKLICAISIICLAVVLVLVLALKDSLRTYFKSLSLSLGVRSLSLGGQVHEALVLGGQVLVLVLVVGGQVLVLGGQVLVNIPGNQLPVQTSYGESKLYNVQPTGKVSLSTYACYCCLGLSKVAK